MTIQAYAPHEAGGKLEPFEYELSSLKPDEVEIDLEYCGICHSDLSMLKNDWGFTGIRLYRDMRLSAESLNWKYGKPSKCWTIRWIGLASSFLPGMRPVLKWSS